MPSPSASWAEKDVTFTSSDGFVLHGTFTTPPNIASRTPFVTIIKLAIYAELAHFLASIGVASIRFDKRGTHASLTPPPSYKGNQDIFNSLGIDDLASDIAAALNFGATQPEVDSAKLFIAGHSEGGILAGRICRKVAELYPTLNLKGYLTLCAFGETLQSAIDNQQNLVLEDLSHGSFVMRNVAKPLLTHVESLGPAGARAFALDPKNKEKDIATFMFKPFPLRWYRDHFTMNLEEESKHIKCPVLIVGGGKDVQCNSANCTRENADRLLVNSPKVDIVVAPHMTHVLKNTELEHVNMLKILEIYKEQAKEPLAPEFTDAVEKFISA
ncbi:UNVERIFIED_CONTAM: hypothetical protein HDU68_009978 [Siphonaria sp. JEL0065]|nr:hypothetical protein HDU68_009978 [Siphonaria sp. JEL0065]